jgi:hypothetical protein
MKMKFVLLSIIVVRVPLLIIHELFGLRKPKVLLEK